MYDGSFERKKTLLKGVGYILFTPVLAYAIGIITNDSSYDYWVPNHLFDTPIVEWWLYGIILIAVSLFDRYLKKNKE